LLVARAGCLCFSLTTGMALFKLCHPYGLAILKDGLFGRSWTVNTQLAPINLCILVLYEQISG